MRYFALATDYDGTIAEDGTVSPSTLASLERLAASGRKLVLVTGRELEDLAKAFPMLELFERVVAENGGVLYCPATRKEKALASPPPPQLVATLAARGVEPLSVGRTIVATRRPHEVTVLEVVRDMGLEMHVVFNKGAVMLLPTGVTKASGLAAALGDLGLSRHNVVGVGDAENDHAFLSMCECSVCVADALPSLKERCDVVTTGGEGVGVSELIDAILEDELARAEPSLARHAILLGKRDDGKEVGVRPYGTSVLIAGACGAGKSTCAVGILERLAESGYQFCLVDPEGDHEGGIGHSVAVGNAKQPPAIEEVISILSRSTSPVIANFVAVPLADRPRVFTSLLLALQELRARTGRPHWIAVDEAHHVLPAQSDVAELALPRRLGEILLVTVRPSTVSPAVLREIDTVIGVGPGGDGALRELAAMTGEALPDPIPGDATEGQASVWMQRRQQEPFRVTLEPPKSAHLRHRRKYAEGDLDERSFFFRGPKGKLNLRAQNLTLFSQIADGVDDETWLFHLRRRHYSRWFRESIKDASLADAAAHIEAAKNISARESREALKRAIEERYTAPA